MAPRIGFGASHRDDDSWVVSNYYNVAENHLQSTSGRYSTTTLTQIVCLPLADVQDCTRTCSAALATYLRKVNLKVHFAGLSLLY